MSDDQRVADLERANAALLEALDRIVNWGHAGNCPVVLWKDGRCRCARAIALAALTSLRLGGGQ